MQNNKYINQFKRIINSEKLVLIPENREHSLESALT